MFVTSKTSQHDFAFSSRHTGPQVQTGFKRRLDITWVVLFPRMTVRVR